MGDYNRTIWKDHIKDQNGNVIQQGTPVSAKNLNNIENQVVALSAKENSLAELVREAIPSGFTTLSDLDYSYMSTNPNAIRLSSDSVAYVNGYKIVIPGGTVINLDAPPSAGTREDLVFLEAWKQLDVNGAEQLRWRLRSVSSVDFSKLAIDDDGLQPYDDGTNYLKVTPQGAMSSPTSVSYQNRISQGFLKASSRASYNRAYPTDSGLFIAGDISTALIFGTTEGYVYAIPMFRVHRRNSGGYSVVNGNGSINISKYTSSNVIYFNQGDSVTTQTIKLDKTDGLNVGDTIGYINPNTTYCFKILSIVDSTTVIAVNKGALGGNTSIGGSYFKLPNRPDSLFADIIYDRDTIDLRHKVSLTGFNYQSLLEENFDKLLRGELKTTAKTILLKTYHGIPKTPIDSNDVFYASFDGTTTAEIGGVPISGGTAIFTSSPTGLACRPTGSNIIYNNITLGNTFTLDFWIDTNKLFNDFVLFQFGTDCRIEIHPNCLYLCGSLSPNADKSNYNLNWIVNNGYRHIRVVVSGTNRTLYINGKQQFQVSNASNFTGNNSPVTFMPTNTPIADIAISNIDRGTAFATLPQDFIDGYARVSSAFNSQRSVFSDAIMSEASLATVHCAGGNNKEVAINVATSAHWTAGDTVQIRGLGSELTTGVIDADTAIARVVTTNNNSNQLYVDDVSKLAVGDTFNIYDVVLLMMSTTGRTITAIDTTNKIITMDGAAFNSGASQILVETTASSSSPIVKTNLNGTAASATSNTIVLPSTFSATDSAYNGLAITITSGTGAGQSRTISAYTGSTKTATVASAWATIPDTTSTFLITGVTVAGTWSNLGTNAATFTLGSLTSALTSQDLYVNYGLVEVSGAGGIPEVLVTTLAGQSNGKSLAANPSVHVRDDFAGKVSGSTTVNPNIAKETVNSVLQPPTGSWVQEFVNNSVGIATLNGICYSSSTTSNNSSDNGKMAQQIFSFNIIRILEDKFGPLPCPPDTASKVAWIKANALNITVNWWGYGNSPTGSKSYLSVYNYYTNAYANCGTNNTNNIQKLSVPLSMGYDLYKYISPDGYVFVLAYTDASDGVTTSAIYTDYCNIEIALNAPIGYDVLAPENPRRDDGRSNILLVRKETKEIQTMFPRANTDGIATYGDYVPKQGLLYTNASAINLTKAKGFMLSNGTGKAGSSNNAYSFLMERASNLNLDDPIYLLNLDDCTISSPNTTSTIYGWSERKYYYNNLDIMPNFIGSSYGYRTDKVLTPNNILDIMDCVVGFKQYLPLSVFNKLMGLYTLVVYNNELYLVVVARVVSGNCSYFTCLSGSTTYNGCCMYKLAKRPLIK